MKKSLTAYFSATGNTKKLAETLQKASGADLFEIMPIQVYTDEDLNWHNDNSRSSAEMKDKSARPKIKNKIEDMGKYQIIFLGFPIWWYTAPRIIDTFLESYDFSGKAIVPFATSGSSEMDNISDSLKEVCIGKASFMKGKRFANYDISSLKKWIDSLNI